MLPWAVRNLVLPLHEWFVGRLTLRNWRELETSQWLPPEELRCFQERKLRQLLLHAWERCPAHRRRLHDVGLHRDDLIEFRLDQLACLPLLDRATVQQELDGLVDWQVAGGPRRYATGGSTGVPLI